MTTILGGNAPFFGFGVGVRSAFRGIYFNGPRIAAVLLVDSTGFDFRECRITGVVGAPIAPDILKGQGIWLGPTGVPERITGTILIEDNTIEDIQASLGYGLALVGFAAEMHVVRNTIRDAATAGILLLLHAGPAFVEENNVVPGLSRYPGIYADFGTGILVVEAQGGKAYIWRNHFVCDNPQADGIALVGDNVGGAVNQSAVVSNQVTMHNSLFGGISLYGLASGNYVGQNQILGDGALALLVSEGSFPEDTAVSNTFTGNNIALFQSSVADVFLDVNSMDNVLAGDSGTVMDLGTGNRIRGYTKGGLRGGLRQFQDIHAAKRASIRSLKEFEKSSGPF
jgi:hypothetical protein